MNIKQLAPFVLRIDFPALSELVAYLDGKAQQQMDELAQTVAALEEKLRGASATLADAERTTHDT